MAGLDSGGEGDALVLDPRFVRYQIAGFTHTGLLLAARQTEDDICAACRNGAVHPTVADGGQFCLGL